MLERELERKLVEGIKAMGGLCWKFVSPGTLGVPDRICILPTGKIIFVELKTQKGVVSKMQEFRHNQLRKSSVDIRVLKGFLELNKFVDDLRGQANAVQTT